MDKTNSNLRLWDQLFETPPSQTKAFKRPGGFSGTAIKPYWGFWRMTEVFGPHGAGWGHDEIEHLTYTHEDGQAVWMSKVTVWYILPETPAKRYVTGPQWGQTMLVSKRYSGAKEMFIDEEAPKKAITDGMMKCLSYLGLGGDVHMGMFDDSKYVAEAKMDERKEREREEAEERRDAKKEEERGKARKAKGPKAKEPDQKDQEPKAEGKGGNGAEPEAKQTGPFEPLVWRDKVCADVKLQKTEQAVRSFWMTTCKPTIDLLMEGDDGDKELAIYVHGKVKEQLAKVKGEA